MADIPYVVDDLVCRFDCKNRMDHVRIQTYLYIVAQLLSPYRTPCEPKVHYPTTCPKSVTEKHEGPKPGTCIVLEMLRCL